MNDENLKQKIRSDFDRLALYDCEMWNHNNHYSQIDRPKEAIAAMKEHLRTDEFLTLSQVKQIYGNLLNRAKIKKHLFWRYSVVWQKELSV
jgi:hypothetical protein